MEVKKSRSNGGENMNKKYNYDEKNNIKENGAMYNDPVLKILNDFKENGKSKEEKRSIKFMVPYSRLLFIKADWGISISSEGQIKATIEHIEFGPEYYKNLSWLADQKEISKKVEGIYEVNKNIYEFTEAYVEYYIKRNLGVPRAEGMSDGIDFSEMNAKQIYEYFEQATKFMKAELEKFKESSNC